MKRLGIITGVILVAIFFLVTGCSRPTNLQPTQQQIEKSTTPASPVTSSVAGNQQPERTVLRFASAMPLDSAAAQGIVNGFIPTVKKNAGETMEVQYYPAGQLFVDKDIHQAVISGSVEMACNEFSWWTSVDQSASFQNLPLVVTSQAGALRLVGGEVGKELAQIPQEQGVVFVNWLHFGLIDGLVTKTGPIKKPENLKGMKIRVYSDLHNRWFKTLGALSVTMSSSEVYMALQRGTIDGTFSVTESWLTRKWIEVAKYNNLMPAAFSSHNMIANKAWFDNLPPEQQKIIMAAGKAAEEWTAGNTVKLYQDALDKARELGGITYTYTPEELAEWKKQSQPVYDYYRQIAGERGRKLLDLALSSQ